MRKFSGIVSLRTNPNLRLRIYGYFKIIFSKNKTTRSHLLSTLNGDMDAQLRRGLEYKVEDPNPVNEPSRIRLHREQFCSKAPGILH